MQYKILVFLTQTQSWQKKKRIQLSRQLSNEVISTAPACGKGFGRTHHRHQPSPQSAHSRSLGNNLLWGSNRQPRFPMMYDTVWPSCWRSLRFLGSQLCLLLNFSICSVPLVTQLGVSLSHVLHLSQTQVVSSVCWEKASLVQAQEVASHSFCPLPSQKDTVCSLKDLYLGATHIRTFHLWKYRPE